MDTDCVSLVQAYYRSIDEDDYERLAEILAETFVHRRPDRTVEGRETFVAFMQSGRPNRDTEHTIEAIYTADGGDRIAVEGRLFHGDGSVWFGFVDSFRIKDGSIQGIRTYTDTGSG